MQIPKRITVNTKRYSVHNPELISAKHVGLIDYKDKYIMVAQRHPTTGRKRGTHEQAQTFWHELTHAILHDMNHRLASNEEFVDAFAHRLNDAIRSAKF